MVCVLLLVATICNAAPSPKHYLVETVDNAGPALSRRADVSISRLYAYNQCYESSSGFLMSTGQDKDSE